MKYDFGFIGAGNMGGALLKAVAKGNYSIAVTDLDIEKSQNIANDTGAASVNIDDLAQNSRFIFLGVKPQGMEKTLSEICETLEKRTDRFILVTMAAGLKKEKIKLFCGKNYPVIRIMPNIPVSVGEGVILTSPDEEITKEELDYFKASLKNAGLVDILEEELFDIGCALSGSGPAYVYMFIEALSQGAEKYGLPKEKAIEYAAKTVMGAAKHLIGSDISPAELMKAVCSPKGTTEQGVKALNDNDFTSTVEKAVEAGFKRSIELSK